MAMHRNNARVSECNGPSFCDLANRTCVTQGDPRLQTTVGLSKPFTLVGVSAPTTSGSVSRDYYLGLEISDIFFVGELSADVRYSSDYSVARFYAPLKLMLGASPFDML